MSVSDLITTLEKLERMHKSLLDLANKKTTYIKENDMEQLDQLIKSEQSHVAAIDTLEVQRQQIVKDYFKANGIAFTDIPTVTQVSDVLQGDEKTKLVNVRERLVKVLGELKEQNDLNQRLVFESLKFVNLTMDMMRPQPKAASSFNYSSSEVRGDATVGKKTFYDSQA